MPTSLAKWVIRIEASSLFHKGFDCRNCRTRQHARASTGSSCAAILYSLCRFRCARKPGTPRRLQYEKLDGETHTQREREREREIERAIGVSQVCHTDGEAAIHRSGRLESGQVNMDGNMSQLSQRVGPRASHSF